VDWRSVFRGVRRLRPLLLPLLLLLAPLGACRQEGGSPSSGPSQPVSTSAPARRIVALTPSLVETLFALGLGDRVVGVGDYVSFPPAAVARPHLGGLFNPNLERVISLKPDLAVLLPSEKDLGAKLKPLGVDLLIVPDESLADVERSFQTIADRCGVPAAGRKLTAEWKAGLALPPIPGPPLKVLISVGRQAGRLGEITAAGHGTYFDELLHRLGAENAFGDSPTLYPQIGMEELVARRPDVVLELRTETLSAAQVAAIVHDWQALPNLPAVRNGRVEVIARDYVLTPGPRLPDLYRQIRDALLRAKAGP
jgi:iron complex transport system substrate-binding protein